MPHDDSVWGILKVYISLITQSISKQKLNQLSHVLISSMAAISKPSARSRCGGGCNRRFFPLSTGRACSDSADTIRHAPPQLFRASPVFWSTVSVNEYEIVNRYSSWSMTILIQCHVRHSEMGSRFGKMVKQDDIFL